MRGETAQMSSAVSSMMEVMHTEQIHRFWLLAEILGELQVRKG